MRSCLESRFDFFGPLASSVFASCAAPGEDSTRDDTSRDGKGDAEAVDATGTGRPESVFECLVGVGVAVGNASWCACPKTSDCAALDDGDTCKSGMCSGAQAWLCSGGALKLLKDWTTAGAKKN